ncbi:major capsid protein [Convivina praedatoris]|uniref:Capsid protein n=1 Tax=Convivina praedatoris TaxID=2880963 RepID=A0ABN8HAX8_9LACO|nr:major capsid protein [Convivina sp. LMG 32447]CAH1856757.1 hypothetical protein R077815_01479 [Convivina sp. LMG 32447]CAH1857144.1 hypothetical protein R078138_01514 [Convivina sp. LMG 32447]CAH1857362.1 hypothetical protein LMG032447_01509 [Convivina sp. LMG 32447]
MALQILDSKFAGIIQAVYRSQSAFQPAFGAMQVADGVTNAKTMFSLKTNDMPVVVGTYNTDANVAFGTGTDNSSRFGKRQEVIYQDKDVPYDSTWAINEGLDNFTVNADISAALADRLDQRSQALIRLFNNLYGSKLVAAASADLGSASDPVKLFGKAKAMMTNNEIIAPIRAYVEPETYNAIIDATLTTTAKGSAVNIDTNGIVKLKGITIQETPEQYMAGAKVIFTPDNIAKAFLGIETVRTMEAHDFSGIELQGAGKYGAFVPDINKKAILTAGVSASTGK